MDQHSQPRDGRAETRSNHTIHEPTNGAPATVKNWGQIQGAAYQAAFDEAAETALASGDKAVADYRIRFLITRALGMYFLEDGQLTWVEPYDSSIHLKIAICDRQDGRFIPGLEVYATLFDGAHNELGELLQTLRWHPTIMHYGRNWNAPTDESLSLRVRVEMPAFPRHDQAAGRRYLMPAEVEFRGITLRQAT